MVQIGHWGAPQKGGNVKQTLPHYIYLLQANSNLLDEKLLLSSKNKSQN